MHMSPLEIPPGSNLYEAVAGRVEWLIENETLRPGDRIPSVRKMHRQLSVSISTVMQAYRILEDRGLIEARPQSGYYVRRSLRQHLKEPTVATPTRSARRVRVSSLSYSLVDKLDQPGFVKLGAAIPDPELMPAKALNRIMGQVLRNHPHDGHAYDTPSGCERLRIQIARRMLDAGVSVSPDEIVTTCGATEALYLALQAVTNPGDTVAVETPTYYGILEKLELLQLKSLEIATDPRDGIDLETLEQVVSQRKIKALVTICNFSNPLGSCMPDERKRRLVEIMSRQSLPIIEDDINGELFFGSVRPKALKAYDQKGLVVYCSSFSKTLSAGCRVGWCIPGDYAEDVLRQKLAITHSSPMPTQLAVAAYLRQGGFDRHLRRIRRCYREQVLRVAEAVGQHFPDGTRVSNPQGGHVLWVEMPESVNSLQLQEEASEHLISVAPGPLFSPIGQYLNCVRLNCGVRWDTRVEEAIATVGKLARKQIDGRAG
jgi:DNA-binding transcriptional MocR family regulator